jgi:hypothetical protein
MAMNRWWPSAWPKVGRCTAATVVFGLTLVLWLYADFGVPWDDHIQAEYGCRVLRYFSSGFSDHGADQLSDLRYYGPLFELVAAVACREQGFPDFELRRLLVALVGLATIVAVSRSFGASGSKWSPCFAVLALVMMPRFVGHAFLNSKDTPFACAVAWLMVLLLGAMDRERWTWGRTVATAVAAGLANAVRPGGFPFVATSISVAMVAWLLTRSEAGHTRSAWAAKLVLHWLVIMSLAWLVMVLPWPWAHQAPLAHPVEAMVQAADFHAIYPVLFAGSVVPSNALPRSYLITMLAITTPLPILVVSMLGVAALVGSAVRNSQNRGRLCLLLTWVMLLPAGALLLRVNLYDGIRHALFVLPGLAVLAGHGSEWLVERWAGTRARAVTGMLVTLVLCVPLVPMVRLHPYEYCYFNSAVGGLSGAAGSYDTDYWLTSYREAAQWINRRQQDDELVLVAANRLSFACARYYLLPRVRAHMTLEPSPEGSLPAPYTLYLGTTRFGLHTGFPLSPVVHEVGREGVTLAVVRGRAASQGPQPEAR